MREGYYIQRMDKMEQVLGILMQQMQFVASADTLHQEVIKDILVDKGIITEAEFKEYLSKRIDKIQEEEKKKQEEDNKKLITPTPEETAKIKEASKENVNENKDK